MAYLEQCCSGKCRWRTTTGEASARVDLDPPRHEEHCLSKENSSLRSSRQNVGSNRLQPRIAKKRTVMRLLHRRASARKRTRGRSSVCSVFFVLIVLPPGSPRRSSLMIGRLVQDEADRNSQLRGVGGFTEDVSVCCVVAGPLQLWRRRSRSTSETCLCHRSASVSTDSVAVGNTDVEGGTGGNKVARAAPWFGAAVLTFLAFQTQKLVVWHKLRRIAVASRTSCYASAMWCAELIWVCGCQDEERKDLQRSLDALCRHAALSLSLSPCLSLS
eukprot:1781951-Rhodomonas_salina.3